MRGDWKCLDASFLVCLAAGLLLGVCGAASAAPTDEAKWQLRISDAQLLFSRAHAELGGGGIFDEAHCAAAEPLLRQALDTLHELPVSMQGRGDVRGFASLQLGRCRAIGGKPVQAIAPLRDAIQWGNVNMAGPARACLAQLYTDGRGVPADPERALALRVLAGDHDCFGNFRDNRRQAAELMLSMLKGGEQNNPMVYALLEQGSSDNWLRSVQIKAIQNSSAGPFYLPDILRGLSAGGESEADKAARRSLSLMAGELFLARGDMTLAYAHLHEAEPALAAASLKAWQQRQPYRLVLSDGQEWRAVDAQP